MTATYEKIATTTLGSATTQINFTSIGSTYTDLIVILQGNAGSGLEGLNVQLGSSNTIDTANNYSSTRLNGNGSAASSSRETTTNVMNIGAIDNTSNGTTIIQIQNYSNSTTYKTTLCRSNTAATYVRAGVGLWQSTNVVNCVRLTTGSVSNFTIGTTATIYGIKAE